VNLATSYLGLPLRSPLIVGASPMGDDLHMAARLQDVGAAAVIMRSLFEEDVEAMEALGEEPVVDEISGASGFPLTPDAYLRQLERLRGQLTIPVIASLNGYRPGGWTKFGRQLQDAGAAAIELNFYQVVTDPSVAADAVELAMLRTVGDLAAAVTVPIAVKLSPYHTALAQLATALELEGAAGVVLFNRFFQPEIDTKAIRMEPRLRLSEPGELLLRLRWLAILSPQLRISLSATGGIQTGEDIARAILAGAHAVQVVSVLLRHGAHVIPTLLQGLRQWMEAHEYDDLESFRGLLNHSRSPDPAAVERANYVRTLRSWSV